MPKQSRLVGAVSLLMAQAVVLLLGYATHLWIGRVLGPGPYGIYGIVLSAQTIIGLFLTLGVPSAVSRFVAQDEAHAASLLRQALRIQSVMAIILAAVALLLAPILARLLDDTSLVGYLSFIAVVVLLQAFYPVYVQFLSGLHRFNKQAALTSLYAIAKVLGAISLLYVFGVYGAFAGFAIGGIVAASIGWYWTRSRGGAEQKKLPLQAFLSFAGTYALILVGLQILMSIDLFMVKAFLGDNVRAGYYNAAVTISRIPYFLLQGLAFILLPSVSALTKPGAPRQEAAYFIKDTLRYLIGMIVPGVALAAATSEGLIHLFFSDDYIPGAAALTVLVVGLGALAFYLLLINIVAGAGRAKFGLYLTAGLLVVSVTLGFVLIPRYELMGAAWQTTLTSLLGLTILTAYTFAAFRIPLPVRSTVNIVLATAVAIAPTYWWEANGFLLLVQYSILLFFYLIVLFVLGEISAADRERIASLHSSLRWIAPAAKGVL